MKKMIIGVFAGLLLPLHVAAETMYIQVEKARLLAKPSAFSKLLATLPYRTAVQVVAKSGAYVRVECAKGTGYVPQKSLNAVKPKFTAKGTRDYVSSDEVALATKGFNEQVESQYRKDHANLPYGDLNQLEKETSYPDAMTTFKSFRQQGKLGEFREGGAAE